MICNRRLLQQSEGAGDFGADGVAAAVDVQRVALRAEDEGVSRRFHARGKVVGELLKDLLYKPPGKPTLAPAKDKRPEFKPEEMVLDAFDDFEE